MERLSLDDRAISTRRRRPCVHEFVNPVGRALGTARIGQSTERPGVSAHADSIARLAAEAVIDKLRRGVMIIDRSPRLLYANSAARTMLDQGDAFRICPDGRLLLVERGSQRRLAGHLRDVAQTSVESLVLRLERGPGVVPYRVLVTPLADVRLLGLVNGSGPLHAVFIFAPRTDHSVAVRILRELYGLTAAESDVAGLLFKGATVREAAAALGISVHTARTHLRHIFLKCEVDSQADLMQLLALGPRVL